MFKWAVVTALAVLCAVNAVGATEEKGPKVRDSWLALGQKLDNKAAESTAQANPAPTAEPWKKGPPIPIHTYEGYSGGFITPTAYICNTGPPGSIVGRPSVAYHFLNLGSKYLHAVTVTQSFFERIEFGYAYNYLNLGTLPGDIKAATGVTGGRNDLHLHHFNLRALLIKENSFDLPLPAITAGIHFKHNDGIKKLDARLGGFLRGMGYERHYGVDYTITATKMFPKLAFGRPVIVSSGMRISRAAQNGLLGFGDSTAVTFEGNVLYMPLDWLILGYEIRTKNNPFHSTNSLIGREQNWHAFSATWVVNEHITVSGVYGLFGTLTNANADNSLAIQVKYEF